MFKAATSQPRDCITSVAILLPTYLHIGQLNGLFFLFLLSTGTGMCIPIDDLVRHHTLVSTVPVRRSMQLTWLATARTVVSGISESDDMTV